MFVQFQRLLKKAPFTSVERSHLLSYIQMLIAITFLVAVGAVTFTMVRSARTTAAKSLVNRGATVTSIISRAAARALDTPARDQAEIALDKVIYDIRAEEGLEYALVIDPNGRAIAHSDFLKKGTTVTTDRAPLDAAPVATEEDGFYYIAYPAQEQAAKGRSGATIYEFVRTVALNERVKERYGGDLELRVGFSLPGLLPSALSTLKRAMPGLAIAFFLLIVGNYLAGIIVRPLNHLKEETALASQAEDDWQLDVGANGEIAEIANNWNKMVANFRTSYQSVVDARREMEVRNRVMLYEKKRTEAIVDSLSDGVMVTDAYGKVSFVNREFENLLEVEREAVANRAPRDLIKDECIVKFLDGALFAPAAAEAGHGPHTRKKQNRAADLEVKRQNGARHLRVSCVPVLDNAGKPCGAITTFRDVTQAKLEEQARKEFVSSVTHELRAPLTAIKSYVEMLIDDEAKDPNLQREFFNTINEEADRLARLIDDMLSMSKIEVGNLVLNKSIVRTRKMLEDAVNGLRSAAKNKSIELNAAIAEDLPDVEADKEMVRVVVTNLLGNGIKYTQEGGRVFLSAELLRDPSSEAGAGTIAVTVADNGPGIPEDELDKIFERFYRGRATANQKVAGNGLGLALAREIAALHGGDIKVASRVGEGSKFTFLLPAAKTSRKVS